jgi:hypothetical protein
MPSSFCNVAVTVFTVGVIVVTGGAIGDNGVVDPPPPQAVNISMLIKKAVSCNLFLIFILYVLLQND